jgi:4-diphosphocytidyl-2-C-methyl-D-erythritol kinase
VTLARVRAFAKINLSLRVLGVRPDGYHQLRTIFQSIALHDTLTIRKAEGRFTLTCDDPDCPADRTNLVWRAAEKVWTSSGRTGEPCGVHVHIAKRIPMQAGLGGGSSDAAAAIRAFGRLWRVGEARQRTLGAALGADVPYFFTGGAALGEARGDRLRRLPDRRPEWVVVAVPAFGVSTKDAFAWFDRRRLRVREPQSSESSRRSMVNDLEAVVIARHPEIGRLVDALRAESAAHAAHVGMSGSGSAVFGLFPRKSDAERAVKALGRSASRSGVRLWLTRTLPRERYRMLAATQPIG